MKIAIYSLTRDRLQYSKIAFASLREKAGNEYAHYVIDNGSEDGTQDWLRNEYRPLWTMMLPENRGISFASNFAVNVILADTPTSEIDSSLIIKADNDCLVITPNILSAFAMIYSDPEAARWVLSPRVTGIVNQPKRVREHKLAGWKVGVTAIVGGLFHVVPAAIYREYAAAGGYPETLALAHGQDDHLMKWLADHRYAKGYVEDLIVEHYRGTDQQAKDFPDYFRRKQQIEEKEPYRS